MNVIEFQDAFPTDRACFEYLWLIKWQDGFKCVSCGHDKAWKIWTRNSSRCKQCKKQISITSGTIFQDRHILLRLIFQAIWYVVSNKQGVSALGLESVLGLGSYRTAWSWLHKLRRAMIRPGRDKLSGLVEVDETLVGGSQSGKRGGGAEGKELVLVCIEDKGRKGLGRVRLKHIPDASGKTLIKAIKELVEPGSTIRTDGWRGYSKLKKNGYDHYYLDEYTFRFNRRKSHSRGKLFYRLIQQALEVNHVPLVTLKANTSSL